MNKKQRLITLVILLFFPAFVHADIIHLQYYRTVNHGKFASPVGIFNSNLHIASNGEFTTNSGEFKSSTCIFNRSSNEFKSSGSIFNTPQGEFSSAGLISRAGGSMIAKGTFASPSQGDFKFSMPK